MFTEVDNKSNTIIKSVRKNVFRNMCNNNYSRDLLIFVNYFYYSLLLLFFFVYEPSKFTLLCLMEIMSRIHEWWSSYSLRMQPMLQGSVVTQTMAVFWDASASFCLQCQTQYYYYLHIFKKADRQVGSNIQADYITLSQSC